MNIDHVKKSATVYQGNIDRVKIVCREYQGNIDPRDRLWRIDLKEVSEKNFQSLSKQHVELKSELEKINKDVRHKFGNKNNFNQKIDELNQETEILIDEIEKWQM